MSTKPLSEKKSWILLLGAILIAGLAFWLTNSYLTNQERKIAQAFQVDTEDTMQVVVANQPLPEGSVVGPQVMAIYELPVSAVSPAAITPQNYNQYEGHMIKFQMASGEPLLTHYVDRPVVDRFSQLLNEGERAVSFDIDSLESISGMLLPGDYIDVLVEYEEPSELEDAEPEIKIKPLLQRVRVLSVDERPLLAREQESISYESHSLDYGSITVAAPYKEAVALTVAKNSHDIRFLLRNEKDEQLVSDRALGGYELVSDDSEKRNDGEYIFYSNMTMGAGVIEPKVVKSKPDVQPVRANPLIRQQVNSYVVEGSNNAL